MEVGAVKQAFNNEIILLKKSLNQARIQIIHKLTRKAKTFAEKKAPEQLKDKLKRKAESAVNEVLIIKKIKPKDIAKFIVTHKGDLKDYLNRPNVDNDKACARLLLHKSMQEKYTFIRNRFSDIPIKDLFMSRQERRKLKKEAKMKEKDKKKRKEDKNKMVNSESVWDVEDVEMDSNNKLIDGKEPSDDEESNKEDSNSENEFMQNGEERDSEDEIPMQSDDNFEVSDGDENDNEKLSETSDDDNDKTSNVFDGDDNDKTSNVSDGDDNDKTSNVSDGDDNDNENKRGVGKFIKSPNKVDNIPKVPNLNDKFKLIQNEIRKKPEKLKKVRQNNKNKNLNEKITSRKFNKDFNNAPVQKTKMADPFFITATGENYMSVAEQRQPDEVKEIHKQGNRKLRRAAMFGYAPKIKPWRNNYGVDNKWSDKQNKFRSKRDPTELKNRSNDKWSSDANTKSSYRGKNDFSVRNENNSVKEEKLHPSWEAKKRQSVILPFQGKKIVFDES